MPSSPPRLVLVTDRHGAAVVEAALDSGLPAVQLRDKELPGRALLALAERLRLATARTGALLFVNDRVDVALAVGADGVQLGTGSMPADVARRLLPPGTLIGVSTHAPGEASAGADFALFGPVWATPSKTGAQGEDRLRAAVRFARPVREALGAAGTTIGVNNGEATGQTIPHVHVHIVPRREGDGAGSVHTIFPRGARRPLGEVGEAIRRAAGGLT